MIMASGTVISTTMTQVSRGSATDIWGVDAQQNIWQYTGSGTNWTQIYGNLKQVSVGSDGTMWGINAGGIIYHYVGGTTIWNQITGNLAQVSVGSASQVWGMNSAGTIYQYAGNNNWNQIPGTMKQVSVGSDGTAWGIDSVGNIWQYNAGNKTWTQMPGSYTGSMSNTYIGPYAQVEVVSAQVIYGLSSDESSEGTIWRYTGNTTNPWTPPMNNIPANSFSATSDETIVLIDQTGNTRLLDY